MNIYETLAAGMARVEKIGRKLVDSTAGETVRRERLENEMAVLFDAVDQTRKARFYPFLVFKDPKLSGLETAYHQQAETIRNRIRELRELPKDHERAEAYQRRAEMLYNEIIYLEKWEKHEIIPQARKVLSDEDAAEQGDLARAEEKAIEQERL
jgi:hypothetical protein